MCLLGASSILLLVAGDVENNPGPYDSAELKNLLDSAGIKLFHLNVCGLFSKILEILLLLQNTSKVDFLLLSETHITKRRYSNNESPYAVPAYTFIHRERNKGKGGRVGAYISDKITWKRRTHLGNDLEAIWIKIFPNKLKSWLLWVLYLPPDTSKYLPKNFNTLFKNMMHKANTSNQEIIIMGDVNINFLCRKNNECQDTLMLHCLKQLITKATKITKESSTLIDIIATNKSENISNSDVIPLGIYDHNLVGCIRKMYFQKCKRKNINTRNYRAYNKKEMLSDLCTVDLDLLYKLENVNTA